MSAVVVNSGKHVMSMRIQEYFLAGLALALTGPALSDPLAYEQEFAMEVTEFANLNRLNIGRLHRDVHADCYIPVTIATVILGDGSVKDISIVMTQFLKRLPSLRNSRSMSGCGVMGYGLHVHVTNLNLAALSLSRKFRTIWNHEASIEEDRGAPDPKAPD